MNYNKLNEQQSNHPPNELDAEENIKYLKVFTNAVNQSFSILTKRKLPFSFDLRNGVCRNLDETPEKFSNSFALMSKFLLIYIPLVLFKIFSKISNPLYGFVCILQLVNFLDTPWSPLLYAYPVIFYIMVTFFLELWLALQNFGHSRIIDNTLICKGEKGKSSWVKTTYASLKVGDIVCVFKGENFPADILLLDASEKIQGEVAAIVNISLISGLKEPVGKKAMNSTKLEPEETNQQKKKGKMNEYMKTLNGKLTIEYPTPDLKTFFGTLKMKNDPKISTATIENMILRGSILLSGWAIGVVIYTGFHSKCLYGNSFTKLKRSSFFRTHVVKYLILTIMIYALLIILTAIAEVLKSSDSVPITRTISMYLPTIPMNLWFILEITLVLNKIYIERSSKIAFMREKLGAKEIQIAKQRYVIKNATKQKNNKLNQHFFELLDLESILDLGLAEYAVFDKTGTIVTNEFEIRSISTMNKRYEINQKILKKRVNEIDLVVPVLRQISPTINRTYQTNMINEPDPTQIEIDSEELVSENNEKKNSSGNDNSIEEAMKKVNSSNKSNLFKRGNSLARENGNKRASVSTPKFRESNNNVQKKNTVMLSENFFSMEKKFPNSPDTILSAESRRRSISTQSVTKTQLLGLNLQYQVEKNYKEDDLFNDINNSEETVVFLLRVFSLCHNSSVSHEKEDEGNTKGKAENYFRKEKLIVESRNFEEKALVLFADMLGYSVISKEMFNKYSGRLGVISMSNRKGLIEEYDILGIITPTLKRRRFSIVLMNRASQNVVWVARGDPDVMLNTIFWEEENFTIYTKLLKKNTLQGLKTLVFGFRFLSREETTQFKKMFKDAKTSLLNHEICLEQIGLEFEKDLNYVGMVGFKDLIREDAHYCINIFKKSGMKIWLLTGDNKANALNAAINSELLSGSEPEISFEFKTEDFGKVAFRSVFEKIENQINQKNKNCLFNFIIIGHAVEQIKSSQYLYEHFKFLLNYCSSLIGYDLNPTHKEFLVSTLRSNQGGSEKVILAIGDGFNDFGMLKSSNFGVQLKNENSDMMNFGNAVTPNLSYLADLFQTRLKQFTYNTYIMIDYLIYNAIFQGFIIFFQEIFTNFTGVPLYQKLHIFLDQNVFHILPCIIFIFINQPHNPTLLKNYPGLHYENMKLKDKVFSCFVFSSTLAILQAFIFVISLRYFIIYGSNSGGKPITLEDLFIVIKYYSIFTTKLRINVLANSHNWVFFSIMVFDIGIMMGFEAGLQWFDIKLSLDTFTIIFRHIQTLIIMLSVATVCFLVNLILEKYIFGSRRTGSFTSRYLHSVTELNEKIALIENPLSDLYSILLSTFKKFSTIDTSLQNVLRSVNKKNEKNQEISVSRWLLQFKNNTETQLYNISFTSSHIKYVHVFCIFMTLISTFFIVFGHYYFEGNSKKTVIPIEDILPLFAIVIGSLFTFTWEFKYHFKFYLLSLYILGLLIRNVYLYFMEGDHIIISSLLVILLTTYFNVNFWIVWIIITLDGINYIINILSRKQTFFSEELNSEPNTMYIYVVLSYCIISFGERLFQGGQILVQEKISKMNFVAKSLYQEDAGYSKELLRLLMPQFILNRLNSFSINENFIADDAGEVTILFCDICDFDVLIHTYNKRIVKLLDELFRVFDTLCRKHGVQKIETVGKTYMACGGLLLVEETISEEIKNINFTKRVLDLASDMMKHASTLKLEEDLKLKLKIGIHHGDAMFGVIGYHKPQFSLIGDTINTTSRLCTTGKETHIMMSERAWNRVRSSKITAEIHETEMKGKGLVKVYHIFEKKSLMKSKIINALNRAGSSKLIEDNEDLQKLLKMKNIFDDEKTVFVSVGMKKMNHLFSNTATFLRKRNQTRINMKLMNDTLRSAKPKSSNVISEHDSENSLEIHKLGPKISEDMIEKPQKNNSNKLLDPIRENKIEEHKSDEEDDEKIKNDTLNLVRIPSKNKGQPNNNNASMEKVQENPLSDDEEDEEIEEKELLKFHKFWLTFKKTQDSLAQKFFKELYFQKKKISKLTYIICGILIIATTILSILIKEAYKIFWVMFGVRVGMGAILIFQSCIVKKLFVNRKVSIISNMFLCLSHLCFILFVGAIKDDYRKIYQLSAIMYLEAELIYSGIGSALAVISFKYAFVWRFVTSLAYIISIYVFDIPSRSQHLAYITITFVFFMWQKYRQWRGFIEYFNFTIYSDKKDIEIVNFVERLLPKHVQKKLLNASPTSEFELGEVFENVSLLFADIVGFTSYSAGKKPREVVEMLSKLFTEFDKECNRLNLYKVYTIGDCYVVMGFLDKDNRKNPSKECSSVVEMGLSMISIIARVRELISFDGLHMRIGIHTGTIIGGIIGTDIVRYDLYGENVVIANKMESNGLPDQINVSEATKDLLESLDNCPYSFEYNTLVELKAYNKNVSSYFLKAMSFQS